jgi:hypothetical protein
VREILQKYGLVARREATPVRAELIERAEANRPQATPGNQMIFGAPFGGPKTGGAPRRVNRNWRTLLSFSESPIPSRGITLVADKIKGLDFDIGPRAEFANDGTDYSEEVDIVRRVLNHPNCEDEDFPTFIGQIIEDQMVFDLGAWEYVESPDPAPAENDILTLNPVPGWSIERNARWVGDPTMPRWVQRMPGNNKFVPLLDKQIEALIIRKRTSRPYGISPVEVMIGIMEAWLGLSSYQAQVASEAYPGFLISMGEATNQDLVDRMRAYWNLEIAGQGRPGIFGGFSKPEVLETKPTGDAGLYLQYEERLIRTAAFCMRLKPQDFNIDRDVNRNTAQTQSHQSLEEAVRPYAQKIVMRVNQRVIPRIAAITKNPSILDLEFTYDTIDPWDAKGEADILNGYVDHDLLTINEGRHEIGLEQIANGDMTITEYRAQYGPASIAPGETNSDGTPKSKPTPHEQGDGQSNDRAASRSYFTLSAAKKKGRRRSSLLGAHGRLS